MSLPISRLGYRPPPSIHSILRNRIENAAAGTNRFSIQIGNQRIWGITIKNVNSACQVNIDITDPGTPDGDAASFELVPLTQVSADEGLSLLFDSPGWRMPLQKDWRIVFGFFNATLNDTLLGRVLV